MTDSTLRALSKPDPQVAAPLNELLRQVARDLIAKAVEAELATFLAQYVDQRLDDGRQAVVRNDYLPERTVQTGVGNVSVQVPKVRDRSGGGVHFNSNLLPPYLKRARSIEELIPWLYLKGISTGDYQEALAALLGERRYVYWWADGVYSNVRGCVKTKNRLPVLVSGCNASISSPRDSSRHFCHRHKLGYSE